MEINTILHFIGTTQDSDKVISRTIAFDYFNELMGYIIADAPYDKVHLICIDDNIFVTHNLCQVDRFINSYIDYLKDGIDVYWQTYNSYEEAYKVSLSMQEITPYCYED